MNPRPLPPDCHEPLTADERAWATRLAQIGPHGDPPAALDARILAAAHAAAARQPRHPSRRWPTMVGAAASLVIVAGLAWQLQPLLRTRPALGEGAGAPAPTARSEGTHPADVLAAAEPIAQSSAASPAAPPAAAPASGARKPAPPLPAPVGAVPAPVRPAAGFGHAAVPPSPDSAGKAAVHQSDAPASATEGSRRAVAEPGRERAAAAMPPQPFPAASAPAESMAMPAPPANAPRASVVAAPDYEPAAGDSAPTHQSDAAAEQDDNTAADRSPATGGTRLAELPVRDDARLGPAAWLQRIRDRRDAGDIEQARASLALFRRSHPRSRVPDDLARLGD